MDGGDESAWRAVKVVCVVRGLEATVAGNVWEIVWNMRQKKEEDVTEGGVVKLTTPPNQRTIFMPVLYLRTGHR